MFSSKNEFISDCLYYDTPNYSTDRITFVCSDNIHPIRYFDMFTSLKCTNLEHQRRQSAGFMNFRNCQMSRIKYNIFSAFSELYTLDIGSIELQYLSKDFFIRANYLKRLLASNNRLTEIVAGQFSNAPNLTEVDLSCNKIAESVLTGARTLQILNLSHNHMETLYRDTFYDSTNLKVLDLSFNTIKKIENGTFANLASLETLSLANNKLTIFPRGAFHEQSNLNMVNLSNNNLLVIELKAFGKMDNLRILDLSQNNLTMVNFNPIGSRFPNLEILRLNNNQLGDLDGFKHFMVPSLNSFALNDNKFNCSYLEIFLNDFEYHSSLSNLDYTGSSSDIENNIHGVNCIRNPSSTIEPDDTMNIREIKASGSTESINHFSHGLVIFSCILSIICVILIFGVFVWAKRMMLNMNNNMNYSCAYNHVNGLEERSTPTVENDFETVLINKQECRTSNMDHSLIRI